MTQPRAPHTPMPDSRDIPRLTSLAPQFLVDDLARSIAYYERKPLEPTPWGTKDFYLEDPDGYIIAFGGSPAD
jgi:hypothetical protein